MKQLLQNKLEKYKKLLNLKNWNTQLIEEEALGVNALTKMIFNDYQAVIKLNKDLGVTEKELALIHELIHLIHRDELDVAMENIENSNVKDLYLRFHERSIEQMAKIIYKLIIIGGV